MNYSELERLADLKDRGALSEDEFEKAKSELLNPKLKEEDKIESVSTASSSDPEIDPTQGFNWGAFFLAPLWGPFNGCWSAVLGIIPIFYLFVSFYLGFQGNRIAWESKEWRDVEHFREVQGNWTSLCWWIFLIFIGVSIFQNSEEIFSSEIPECEDVTDTVSDSFNTSQNALQNSLSVRLIKKIKETSYTEESRQCSATLHLNNGENYDILYKIKMSGSWDYVVEIRSAETVNNMINSLDLNIQ